MTASSVGHVPSGTRPPCVLVLLGFRRPCTNERTDGTTSPPRYPGTDALLHLPALQEPAHRPRRPRGLLAGGAVVPPLRLRVHVRAAARLLPGPGDGLRRLRPGRPRARNGGGHLRADRVQGGGPDGARPRRGPRPLRQRGGRDGARVGRPQARAEDYPAHARGDREARPGRLLPGLRRRRRIARRTDAALLDAARRAAVARHAALARRPARIADTPPVPDQKVREARPVLARHETHQVALDLDGILLLREAETLREPAHVRVDDDALCVPPLGRDDVRRLARDAGKAQQIVEALGHLAAIVLD